MVLQALDVDVRDAAGRRAVKREGVRMGDWGLYPWDNDLAADWFDHLFNQTSLAEKVGETLRKDVWNDWQEIRAAGFVLIHLGRIYIWPIDRLEDDLAVAVTQFEAMRNMFSADDPKDPYLEPITAELERLRARLGELRPGLGRASAPSR